MAKRPVKKKRVKEHHQIARTILDAVVPDAGGEGNDIAAPDITANKPSKNSAAVALGRLGGLKGGKARAEKLTAKKRSQIAKKAAAARWANTKRD